MNRKSSPSAAHKPATQRDTSQMISRAMAINPWSDGNYASSGREGVHQYTAGREGAATVRNHLAGQGDRLRMRSSPSTAGTRSQPGRHALWACSSVPSPREAYVANTVTLWNGRIQSTSSSVSLGVGKVTSLPCRDETPARACCGTYPPSVVGERCAAARPADTWSPTGRNRRALASAP